MGWRFDISLPQNHFLKLNIIYPSQSTIHSTKHHNHSQNEGKQYVLTPALHAHNRCQSARSLTASTLRTASCATPSSSEATMSSSDTNSDKDALKPRGQPSKENNANYKLGKKPNNDNLFFYILLLLPISILLPLYIGATCLDSIAISPLRTAHHSIIITINTTTIATTETVVAPAPATVTTTKTVTATVSRETPTEAIGGPIIFDNAPAHVDGVPRSNGFWKHLAREMFYEECFRGCRGTAGAGCSLKSEGNWERACRQTDLLIRKGVDCSATNLMEKGGEYIYFPNIPEVCLEGLAKLAKEVRIKDLRRRGAHRG